MSKANPRKAMAALLPLPIKVGRDLTVAPMTLGMYAALERIGSTMVTGKEPKDLVELIPSLYLLTHGATEIFRPDFFDAAFAWADTVPTSVVERIKTACYRQLNAAFDVIPEEDPKKKAPPAMTAGSPRSSTGRPRPTAGATAKSCTKCPSPRSASSVARKASKPTKYSRSLKSRR